MSEIAINVSDVTKIYKLYDRNRDRLIDSFGLSKKPRYKEHYALNKMSFQIKKGETVGIIGTNGAGKSTILKIITGVLNPTEGDVEIDGRISALLELGAGFNPEYTGIENIYLNGTMMGFSKEEVENKMEDILNFADIGEFVYQPVKSYSSGMFVRLAFAVAINIEPEILIVDEALSVGDVFFQAKCYKKFEEFKKRGKTILFVSHDLGSISRYCDRVILLNKGTKLAEGTPKEIWPESWTKVNKNNMPVKALWIQCLIVVAIIVVASFGGDTAAAFLDSLILMSNVAMTIPTIFLAIAFIAFKKNDSIAKPFIIFKSKSFATVCAVVVIITVGFANVFTIIQPAIEEGKYIDTIAQIAGPVIFSIVALVLFNAYENKVKKNKK